MWYRYLGDRVWCVFLCCVMEYISVLSVLILCLVDEYFEVEVFGVDFVLVQFQCVFLNFIFEVDDFE